MPNPTARPQPHSVPLAPPAAMGLVAAIAIGLAGCATTTHPASAVDPVGAALAQPFRDLSLIRGEAPSDLLRAAAEPYRALRDCAAIAAELDMLKSLLGPDVDAAQAKDNGAGFAGAVVSGAAGLPFRGVVRRLTGAHKRDEGVATAVLGAMVRRGFLKGEGAALGCATSAS